MFPPRSSTASAVEIPVGYARSRSVDAIRRKMALIRSRRHEDVREVLADAETVVGRRQCVRPPPCAALGAAGAASVLHLIKRREAPPAGQTAAAPLAGEATRLKIACGGPGDD